jgi:hypothetical protein
MGSEAKNLGFVLLRPFACAQGDTSHDFDKALAKNRAIA